jgi:hypothetical protein
MNFTLQKYKLSEIWVGNPEQKKAPDQQHWVPVFIDM